MGFREWWEGPSHPNQVGTAYKELLDGLAKDDQAAKDSTFKENFANLKDLQTTEGDKAYGKVDWKETPKDDPLERWRKEVDGMIQSKNPVLMKEGIAQLQAYQQKANAQEATPVAGVSYAKALGLQPGTKEYNDFIHNYIEKPAQYKPDYVSPTEASKLKWLDKSNKNPIVGQRWDDIRGKVDYTDPKSRNESKGAYAIVDQFEDLLFNEEQGLYTGMGDDLASRVMTGLEANIEQITQFNPNWRNYQQFRKGSAVSLAKALGESGALSNQDVNRAFSLIPNVTGILPDSPSVAKKKIELLRRLIDAHAGNSPEGVRDILEDVPQDIIDSRPKEFGTRFGVEVGTIEGDQMFLGGDETDQGNWQRVKNYE